MTTLKKQTVQGVKWLVGASFLQKALSVGTMVILARILNPSIFGLFALAFVAIDGLGMLKSMGFDSALIQRKDNIDKAANTAFFIIPAIGLLLYLILSFSAPIIGKFLNSSDVVSIIRALGIVFIIGCFGRIPATLMQKNMQFKKISMIEISTTFLYSIFAIIFALSGMGIWSLVFAYIIKTLSRTSMYWIFAKWHPRFEFDKKIALEMFHFGKFVFLATLVWFLKMNLDNILVGKLLGVAALGLYAIAFNIANFSADYFGSRVHAVTYPAYSKLQSDLDDLRNAALKVFKHVSLVALPFGIGLFLLSGDFLGFVYGEKWIGAISVLRILAWAGIFNTLTKGFSGIFLACGKPKLEFLITTLQVSLFVMFITPMVRLFGINGVGAVVAISGIIAFIITLAWSMRLLRINLKQIFLSLKPPLLSTFFMALGIVFFKTILLQFPLIFSEHYNFIILFLTAVIIYAFSLFKVEKALFCEVKSLVFK